MKKIIVILLFLILSINVSATSMDWTYSPQYNTPSWLTTGSSGLDYRVPVFIKNLQGNNEMNLIVFSRNHTFDDRANFIGYTWNGSTWLNNGYANVNTSYLWDGNYTGTILDGLPQIITTAKVSVMSLSISYNLTGTNTIDMRGWIGQTASGFNLQWNGSYWVDGVSTINCGITTTGNPFTAKTSEHPIFDNKFLAVTGGPPNVIRRYTRAIGDVCWALNSTDTSAAYNIDGVYVKWGRPAYALSSSPNSAVAEYLWDGSSWVFNSSLPGYTNAFTNDFLIGYDSLLSMADVVYNGYNFTQQPGLMYLATMCTENSDCGFCQVCNVGVCENTPVYTDPKGDCTSQVLACTYGGNYWTSPDGCDGLGTGCIGVGSHRVDNGNICINTTDYNVPVTPDHYCGIWSNCSIGNTSAPEFYVGFSNSIYDSTGTCNPTNPLAKNTFQNTFPSVINQDGWADTCSFNIVNQVVENITTGVGSEPTQVVIASINGTIDYNNVTTLKVEASTVPVLIDFTGQSINITGLDTSAIIILPKSVSINSAIAPELNKPAKLTFGNIGPGATVLRNGEPCGSYCSNIRQTGATLSFDVTGFSTFSVSEEVAKGCSNVRNIVFAAFAIIAIILIITAAFLLIHFDAGFGAYIALTISSVGLAIILFVGYIVISQVQNAICVV